MSRPVQPKSASKVPAKSVYVVRALSVRDERQDILAWIRVDPFSDGTKPTDRVFLRDGSSHGQAEAMKRVALDLSLLYPTEDEAVQDGLTRLREAHARGDLVPLRGAAR